MDHTNPGQREREEENGVGRYDQEVELSPETGDNRDHRRDEDKGNRLTRSSRLRAPHCPGNPEAMPPCSTTASVARHSTPTVRPSEKSGTEIGQTTPLTTPPSLQR